MSPTAAASATFFSTATGEAAVELTLVSFADSDFAAALGSTLAHVGYAPRRLTHDAWLNAPPAELQRPAVLALDANAFASREIVARLVARNCRASLGVFAHLDPPLAREVSLSCGEFVSWPCSADELRLRLERVCAFAPPKVDATHALLLDEFAQLNLIGRSGPFLQALRLIKRLAACDAPAVIGGETGTGKEVAARAIHYLSTRRDYPFVPVNCGAVPDNLIENELFGHERGAFTDAKEARQGVIAQAEGGTLFLDEVDALSPKAQVALLRFLQDRQYRPLGSTQVRTANVRVIAATNADLENQVAQGRFRLDLMFRLNVLSLVLPPLRERRGDIQLLAQHFLARLCASYSRRPVMLHPRTAAWMADHRWPGNVRELESFIHRRLLLCDPGSAFLVMDDGHDDVRASAGDTPLHVGFHRAKQQLIAEFEKSSLCRALSMHGGNVTLAAKVVGKERRAFGKLLKKYAIDINQYRGPAGHS